MIDLLYNLIAQSGLDNIEQNVLQVTEEPAGQYMGAVSNLIAAVMQTAGLYAQSDILLNYRPMVESFATLIYIVAVIGAIISVAIYGNYKQAAYLFIGPVIFYWLIYTTTAADVTNQRTGNRIGPDSEQSEQLFEDIITSITAKSSATTSGTKPQVSWFFAKFDSIVTEVVQNVVSLLLDEEFNEDLNIAATERIYSRVLAAESDSAGFNELVSYGVIGLCAENNRLSREISALSESTKPEAIAKKSVLEARHTSVVNQYKLMPESPITYLRAIELIDEDLATCGPTAKASIERIKASDKSQMNLSCSEIWSLTCLGALNEANITLNTLTNEANVPGVPISEGESKDGINWQVVRQRIESSLTNAKEKGLDPDKAAFFANQLLAAQIIKNTMRNTAHHQLASRISGQHKFVARRFDHIFGVNESFEYSNLANMDAQGDRSAIVHFAAWVPYIQGFLLYLLSISFPFFAVFVLMPDRWSAIGVWMSLWVWVKCWDIGFAVVFFARNFLWDYMQSGAGVPGSISEIDWSSQDSIYRIMYVNDPMATTHTYYNLIALFTLSVPLITAHFCAGAPMLYRAFKTAIDEPSRQIGERRAAEVRLHSSHSVEQGDPTKGHPEEVAHALKAVKNATYGQDVNGNPLSPQREAMRLDALSKGDASFARFLRGIANEGIIDFRFGSQSERFGELREANAISTGRNDPYLHSTADSAINAGASFAVNSYYGRDMFGSEGFDNKGSSDNTNHHIQDSASSAPEGTTGN